MTNIDKCDNLTLLETLYFTRRWSATARPAHEWKPARTGPLCPLWSGPVVRVCLPRDTRGSGPARISGGAARRASWLTEARRAGGGTVDRYTCRALWAGRLSLANGRGRSDRSHTGRLRIRRIAGPGGFGLWPAAAEAAIAKRGGAICWLALAPWAGVGKLERRCVKL